jgi:hypothetical protein
LTNTPNFSLSGGGGPGGPPPGGGGGPATSGPTKLATFCPAGVQAATAAPGQCTNNAGSAYNSYIGSDDAHGNSFGVISGSGNRIFQFALRLIY